MALFSKLRNRLRKSSSKIEEGLEAIVQEGGTEEEVPQPDAAQQPPNAPEPLVLGADQAVTPDAERMPPPPAPLDDMDEGPVADRPAETPKAEPASDPAPTPAAEPWQAAEPQPESEVIPEPEPAPQPEPTPIPMPEPEEAPEPDPELPPAVEPAPEPLPEPRPTPPEELPAPPVETPPTPPVELPEAPAETPPAAPDELPPLPPSDLPGGDTGTDLPQTDDTAGRKGFFGRFLNRSAEQPEEQPAPEAQPAPQEQPIPEAPQEPAQPSAWATPDLPPAEPESAPMPDTAPASSDDRPQSALAALEDEQSAEEPERRGLFGRVLGGGKRTVIKRELDDDMLESLEELLITADMGVDTAMRVTANMAEGRFGKRLSVDEIKGLLAHEIARIMDPVAVPMPLYPKKPQVVLVVGVNGSGKTTTIGKLASQFRDAGKSVIIAAGDTFRAAAVEQLQVWGDRAGVPVMTAPEGSDPASLAYDAMARAEAEGADLLMIDTAGRLQNRQDLMAELEKIVRVIRKRDETAPHNTLLVLDATTGQNALSQVETFRKMADVSGLVMTKLDGTAKGGVLVALADKFGLPIHAIGVGEKIDDLAPFDPEEFADALAGIDG